MFLQKPRGSTSTDLRTVVLAFRSLADTNWTDTNKAKAVSGNSIW